MIIFNSLLIGLIAGFLSGQFGIGGGLITTPAIRLILGQSALIAVGTPLPVIIPTAISGFYNYHQNKLVDYKSGLIIGLAGALFSVLGARLTIIIGGRIILIITAILITLVSLRYLRPNSRRRVRGTRPTSILTTSTRYPLPSTLILIGITAGFMSGFLGLGGGFVIIPALTILFGKDIKEAFGTSLLAIIFIAIPGSITHLFLGNINLSIAFFITLGVIPGAYFGSKLTVSLPSKLVNIMFGSFLIITAVFLLMNEVFM